MCTPLRRLPSKSAHALRFAVLCLALSGCAGELVRSGGPDAGGAPETGGTDVPDALAADDVADAADDAGGDASAADTGDAVAADTGQIGADASGDPDATAPDAGFDSGVIPTPCGTTTFAWDAGSNPVGAAVVAGSFNGWGATEQAGGWPMEDPDGDGVWTVTRVVQPGTWQYKMVIDGTWFQDPTNPLAADDTFGGFNSVLVVDCDAASLDLEAWETDPATGALSADLRFDAGGDPLAPSSVRVTLNHDPVPAGAVSVTGGAIAIALDGLPDGIHDVRVSASSAEGRVAGPVLLKFHLGVSTDWADDVMYFAMTDRFRNGDPTNDAPVAGADGRVNWQGGDFAGLRSAVAEGYFDDLGVNALWLSWPIDNFDGCEPGGRPAEHRCGMNNSYATTDTCYTAYHGYWPRDLDAVDAHFGTRAELQALVDEAHAHGLRIVLDFTANHVHTSSPLFSEQRGELFNWPNHGSEHICANVGWDTEPETCWFTGYLADLDYRRAAAVDAIVDRAVRLIVDTGADGFRVDAVKHIDRALVRALRSRLRDEVELTGIPFYLVGETFTGETGLIGSYLGDDLLHGQFDFPLNLRVLEAFATETLGLDDLDAAARGIKASYGGALMSNFLGNHDLARFTSMAAGDIYCPPWDAVSNSAQGWLYPPGAPSDAAAYRRLRLAMTFIMTIPGLPLVYYGDEFGMPGAGDPDNRRFMRFGGDLSGDEAATLRFVRRLGQVRAAHPALRTGTWGAQLWQEASLLAYPRTSDGEVVIVVLNRGADSRTLSLSVGGLGIGDDAVYEDALADSPAALTVSGGALAVTVSGRTPMILVPR